MKNVFKSLIKLLSVIIVIYFLIFAYFKNQEVEILKAKEQRGYQEEIYLSAESHAQYFLYSEYELKTQRNNRIKKILVNFNNIMSEKTDADKKRNKLLRNELGLNHFNNLKSIINLLDRIQKTDHPMITKIESWDLYFFEKSLVLEYLEKLQAPVLDNELIRNLKNESH